MNNILMTTADSLLPHLNLLKESETCQIFKSQENLKTCVSNLYKVVQSLTKKHPSLASCNLGSMLQMQKWTSSPSVRIRSPELWSKFVNAILRIAFLCLTSGLHFTGYLFIFSPLFFPPNWQTIYCKGGLQFWGVWGEGVTENNL